jgi:hypothetical protein
VVADDLIKKRQRATLESTVRLGWALAGASIPTNARRDIFNPISFHRFIGGECQADTH